MPELVIVYLQEIGILVCYKKWLPLNLIDQILHNIVSPDCAQDDVMVWNLKIEKKKFIAKA